MLPWERLPLAKKTKKKNLTLFFPFCSLACWSRLFFRCRTPSVGEKAAHNLECRGCRLLVVGDHAKIVEVVQWNRSALSAHFCSMM